MRQLIRSLLASVALLAVASTARSQSLVRSAADNSFDYYLLTLSWAPDFCAASGGFKDAGECGAGRHLGFIVHGLWPQSSAGRGPMNCGSASRVPNATITATLGYIPSASLIQHEWKTHGTCSGLSADAYFALLRRARDGVKIPASFASLTRTLTESPAEVRQQFAAANPTYNASSIRATCTGGTLQEVRICLDRPLQPKACTASAGSCMAAKVKVLPVR